MLQLQSQIKISTVLRHQCLFYIKKKIVTRGTFLPKTSVVARPHYAIGLNRGQSLAHNEGPQHIYAFGQCIKCIHMSGGSNPNCAMDKLRGPQIPNPPLMTNNSLSLISILDPFTSPPHTLGD